MCHLVWRKERASHGRHTKRCEWDELRAGRVTIATIARYFHLPTRHTQNRRGLAASRKSAYTGPQYPGRVACEPTQTSNTTNVGSNGDDPASRQVFTRKTGVEGQRYRGRENPGV